jgi:ubiquinone/menaquinone biosynthesis C-methylase UbiE
MGILLVLARWLEPRLYTRFAWSYDLVAWLVSLGQWKHWQVVGIDRLPPGSVLEIGHGPGHVMARLLRSKRPAAGLDLSPQMSRQAARRLAKARLAKSLVRGRAQSLPFASGVFHGVISTFPSAYILDAQTAAEAWRVLRPGGPFIVLPGAYVTGRSLPDRFAAWLNRRAGQAEALPTTWRAAFEHQGFEAKLDRVQTERAEVLCITALKPAAVAR